MALASMSYSAVYHAILLLLYGHLDFYEATINYGLKPVMHGCLTKVFVSGRLSLKRLITCQKLAGLLLLQG